MTAKVIPFFAFYNCDLLAQVTLENKKAWKAGNIAISTTDPADLVTAAEDLESIYGYY